jgi:hypothetical protein
MKPKCPKCGKKVDKTINELERCDRYYTLHQCCGFFAVEHLFEYEKNGPLKEEYQVEYISNASPIFGKLIGA